LPKVWIYIDAYGEYVVDTKRPEVDGEVVECDMNASLFRQIKAAVKKFELFQNVLEKHYADGVAHPGFVRRVR